MKYALSISAALLLAMSQTQPSLAQNGANSLTTFDAPAFAYHLVGYSQALKQLGGDVVAAHAGGVRDGFRLQKRAFQRVDRADIRLRGSCPHRHTDG